MGLILPHMEGNKMYAKLFKNMNISIPYKTVKHHRKTNGIYAETSRKLRIFNVNGTSALKTPDCNNAT
jgi:hypothetical protein